jgi:hypothetical protein
MRYFSIKYIIEVAMLAIDDFLREEINENEDKRTKDTYFSPYLFSWAAVYAC